MKLSNLHFLMSPTRALFAILLSGAFLLGCSDSESASTIVARHTRSAPVAEVEFSEELVDNIDESATSSNTPAQRINQENAKAAYSELLALRQEFFDLALLIDLRLKGIRKEVQELQDLIEVTKERSEAQKSQWKLSERQAELQTLEMTRDRCARFIWSQTKKSEIDSTISAGVKHFENLKFANAVQEFEKAKRSVESAIERSASLESLCRDRVKLDAQKVRVESLFEGDEYLPTALDSARSSYEAYLKAFDRGEEAAASKDLSATVTALQTAEEARDFIFKHVESIAACETQGEVEALKRISVDAGYRQWVQTCVNEVEDGIYQEAMGQIGIAVIQELKASDVAGRFSKLFLRDKEDALWREVKRELDLNPPQSRVDELAKLRFADRHSKGLQDYLDWFALRERIENAKTSAEISALESVNVSTSFARDREVAVIKRMEFLQDPKNWSLLKELAGHDAPIYCLAYSSDGCIIASGSSDKTLRLWEMETGSEIGKVTLEDAVYSVAFSPDGSLLAVGSQDSKVRILDVKKGKVIKTLSGHSGAVRTVSFSRGGSKIVSGSQDRTIRIWDAKMGKALHTFVGHEKEVMSVDFNPDDTKIVSGSNDKTARVWDLATEKQVLKIRQAGEVLSVAFSPSGDQLVCGGRDRRVLIYNPITGEQGWLLGYHNSHVISVGFNHDGSKVFGAGFGGTVQLSTVAGTQGPGVKHGNYWRAVVFNSDWTRMMTGGDPYNSRTQKPVIKIWGVK